MRVTIDIDIRTGDGGSGYSALGSMADVTARYGHRTISVVHVPSRLLPEALELLGRAIGEKWREGDLR